MLEDQVFRVILSYKRRLVRKLKKRKPGARLKARTYYRKNKRKILLRRKRYITKNKAFLRTRKLYKRQKPAWMTRRLHKVKPPKTKSEVIKPKKHEVITKPKIFKPKPIKPRKVKVRQLLSTLKIGGLNREVQGKS